LERRSGEEAPKESIKFSSEQWLQYISRSRMDPKATKNDRDVEHGTNKPSLDIPGLGAYPKYLDGGQLNSARGVHRSIAP